MMLLDTNVLSEVRKSNCHAAVRAWVASQPVGLQFISAITVLEIQRGISLLAQRGDRSQAAVLTRWLEEMVLPAFDGRILPLDHVVARRAAQLPSVDAHDYRDSLIAATGLVYGATVVTRHINDFERAGVPVVNPWKFEL